GGHRGGGEQPEYAEHRQADKGTWCHEKPSQEWSQGKKGYPSHLTGWRTGCKEKAVAPRARGRRQPLCARARHAIHFGAALAAEPTPSPVGNRATNFRAAA